MDSDYEPGEPGALYSKASTDGSSNPGENGESIQGEQENDCSHGGIFTNALPTA